MEDLVVSSSLQAISPSPYFCFARAKALSAAIQSALSLYSTFLSVPAFFFGLPRDDPDKRFPYNKKGRFYSDKFYLLGCVLADNRADVRLDAILSGTECTLCSYMCFCCL